MDRRQQSCAYVHCLDGNGDRVWRTLPIVDEDLPFDDPQDDVREWQLDYFQHLLDHPELVLAPDAVVRTFHICVDHPTARAVAAEGKVDCSFHCPADSADCPIQQFATKIRHAVLIRRDATTNRTTWLCR